MAPGAGAKAISVVLLLTSGALGLYSVQEHQAAIALRVEKVDAAGHLDECTKARETSEKAREASEKTATLSAADLDASRGELEALRRQKDEADQRLLAFKSITDKFRQMIDAGRLQVAMRHGRMVVKLPAGVLFASGSADLSKDGQAALAEVARILKQFPDRRFEVAGHTDNIPVVQPSAFKNNLELSTMRAVTVANYLNEKGVNAARLSAAGYSAYQPVASNAREVGRQENRRIEIAVLPNLTELPPSPEESDGGAGGGG